VARGKLKHPTAPETRIRTALKNAFAPAVKSLTKAVVSGSRDAVREAHDNLLGHVEQLDDHLRASATSTADSVRRQLTKILGLDPDEFSPDLSGEIDDFAGSLNDMASGAAADLLDRAEEMLGLEDPDEGAVRGSLNGVVGTLVATASMAFAYAFGQLNKAAQGAAGVEEYEWSSLHDGRVRPEHEAMDGTRAAWDDPPLSADKSDSGEDCHPGDDWGCRCLGQPVLPEVDDDAA
jgi:SPP1 gp7 family putative phage head morphogenesis protein